MPRVLVVATSRKTRGGITSVIKAHETGEHGNGFTVDGLKLTATGIYCANYGIWLRQL